MSENIDNLRILIEHSEWEYVNSALELLDCIIEEDATALQYISENIQITNGLPSCVNTSKFHQELSTYFVHWLALYRPEQVESIHTLVLGNTNEIPEGISLLPNLLVLDIRNNQNITKSDFSHCAILINETQLDRSFPNIEKLIIAKVYNRYRQLFYYVSTVDFVQILRQYPKLKQLQGQACKLHNFPSPSSITIHPIEMVHSSNCILELNPCTTTEHIYTRITKMTISEEAIETFLPLCNNLSELEILGFKQDASLPKRYNIPTQQFQKLTSFHLQTGSNKDFLIHLNIESAHRPSQVYQWAKIFDINSNTKASNLARQQQKRFAERWNAGDPLAQEPIIQPQYTPTFTAQEPLNPLEKEWLTQFNIHNDTLHWHIQITAASLWIGGPCHAMREQKILDTIPLDELCAFTIGTDTGQPIFHLRLGNRYPRIQHIRKEYLEIHYSKRIALLTVKSLNSNRINIPNNAMPADAQSIVLNAESFTYQTLDALAKMPSLKRLSLNNAVSAIPEDFFLLTQYLQQLTQLTHLEICSCGLTEIPENIGTTMLQLEKLFLWGNNLTTLPSSLRNLLNLRFLSITGSILEIPMWVWNGPLLSFYHRGYNLSEAEKIQMQESTLNVIV